MIYKLVYLICMSFVSQRESFQTELRYINCPYSRHRVNLTLTKTNLVPSSEGCLDEMGQCHCFRFQSVIIFFFKYINFKDTDIDSRKTARFHELMVSTLTCFTQYIRVLQYIFSLPFPVSEQGNALVSIILVVFFITCNLDI